MLKSPTKLTKILTAVTTSLCVIVPAAPSLAAPVHSPKGNIVTFGDSYFANPTVPAVTGELFNAPLDRGTRQGPEGCVQDKRNIPSKLAKQLKLTLRDYSCAGSLSYFNPDSDISFRNFLDVAIKDKALDQNTKYVVIQYGFNDSYNVLTDKFGDDALLNTPKDLKETYAWEKKEWNKEFDTAVVKIKKHAPHAKIVFADYPTISDPETGVQCLVHMGPIKGILVAPWVRDAEWNLTEWNREAAERHDGVFANLHASTLDQSQCAAPAKRHVSGLIDFGTKDYNLPVHLSEAGNQKSADLIVKAIKLGKLSYI